MQLSETTEKEYRWYVKRWQDAGEPDPQVWVEAFAGGASRRNARAALMWWHRLQGRAVSIPHQPVERKVPEAFSPEQLAFVREAATFIHPRCRPVLDFLYGTGARIGEAVAVQVADVTSTHVILRNTKRRPGGMRVERAIPLGPVTRDAIGELLQLSGGRLGTLLGCGEHIVRRWCVSLTKRTTLHVYPHKFRATFATMMLGRGVDVRVVQELMGHTDLETTMRYLAMTDERLAAGVQVL